MVRLQGLASLIDCSMKQAAKVVMTEPALLDVSSKDIQRRLREVDAALGGDTRRTNRVVRRMPCLLAFDFPRQRSPWQGPDGGVPAPDASDTHSHHIKRLASLFCGVGEGDPEESWARARTSVRGLLFDEPLLLVMTYEDTHDRLQGLAKMLQSHGYMGGSSDLTHRCLRAPWLLTTSADNVDRKLRSLATVLHLTRSQTLDLALGYPKILTLSEDNVRSKVASLCEKKSSAGSLAISPQSLQYMIRQEPSFLMRSTEKIQAGLRMMTYTFETRANLTASPSSSAPSTSSPVPSAAPRVSVLDLVKRRASILTRNDSNIIRCYDALSIWEMTGREKGEIFTAHPSLLRLRHVEIHSRCRWLRALVLSNGWFHSALRRVSGAHLGVIILHLPKCWSRFQYLAESNLESQILIMEAVQSNDRWFGARFPGYRRWLTFKRNEIGRVVPWRSPIMRRAEGQGGLAGPSPPLRSSSASLAVQDTAADHGPVRTVVAEEKISYSYGVRLLHKPQRPVPAGLANLKSMKAVES